MTNSIIHGLDLTHFAPTVPVNIDFSYSTFYAGGATAVACGADSTLPTGLSFVNNIFYAPTSSNSVSNGGTKCVFDTNIMYPQASSTGTNTLIEDPLLVSATSGDFHLQMTSPAIDAAKTTASDPSTDYDGTLRPQGPKWDLGAFEYH